MSRYSRELETITKNVVEKIQPLLEEYRKAELNLNNKAMQKEGERLHGLIESYKQDAINKGLQAKEDYIQRLEKKAEGLTGKELDLDDLGLLTNDLIELTRKEFNILCDRHENNRAMQKALVGYAKKHNFNCNILTDEAKQEIAENEFRSLEALVGNNGGWGVSSYILKLAGEDNIFNAAKQIEE